MPGGCGLQQEEASRCRSLFLSADLLKGPFPVLLATLCSRAGKDFARAPAVK